MNLSSDTPIERVIDEKWVTETLSLYFPPKIVAHRVPEIMSALATAPRTAMGIKEAFCGPLRLFGCGRFSPMQKTFEVALMEKIEWMVAAPEVRDKPYIKEWIDANLHEIQWTKKDRSYWTAIFKRANAESRLPMLHPRHTLSDRARSAQWHEALFTYYLRVVIPTDIQQSFDSGKIKLPSDWIRTIRYIERQISGNKFIKVPSYPLRDRYGAFVGMQLEREFRDATEGLTCVDNFRCAEASNREEMSYYRWQQRNGCCGRFDHQVTVEGRVFWIGANYGH